MSCLSYLTSLQMFSMQFGFFQPTLNQCFLKKDFLIPSVIHGGKCFCGFNLISIFGKHSLYSEHFFLKKSVIRMVDTVKYFNIILCDITEFLLKFLYGLITDITFQNVLLCFDVNINVYFSNKKCWKMIRNMCLYDS